MKYILVFLVVFGLAATASGQLIGNFSDTGYDDPYPSSGRLAHFYQCYELPSSLYIIGGYGWSGDGGGHQSPDGHRILNLATGVWTDQKVSVPGNTIPDWTPGSHGFSNIGVGYDWDDDNVDEVLILGGYANWDELDVFDPNGDYSWTDQYAWSQTAGPGGSDLQQDVRYYTHYPQQSPLGTPYVGAGMGTINDGLICATSTDAQPATVYWKDVKSINLATADGSDLTTGWNSALLSGAGAQYTETRRPTWTANGKVYILGADVNNPDELIAYNTVTGAWETGITVAPNRAAGLRDVGQVQHAFNKTIIPSGRDAGGGADYVSILVFDEDTETFTVEAPGGFVAGHYSSMTIDKSHNLLYWLPGWPQGGAAEQKDIYVAPLDHPLINPAQVIDVKYLDPSLPGYPYYNQYVAPGPILLHEDGEPLIIMVENIFDPERWKEWYIEVIVSPINPDLPSYLDIDIDVAYWDDIEQTWVERWLEDSINVANPEPGTLVWDYGSWCEDNPEWVSIHLDGYNVVIEGLFFEDWCFIPEPGTMAPFGLGVLALLALRRRK